ncbi:MAG TPA: hypothetical protein VGJ28_04445 [Micromonosporaceae bacterium]|jgi:hypothetical protein
MVRCKDGTYSMSGGIGGACSDHHGEGAAVYGPKRSHPTPTPTPTPSHSPSPSPTHSPKPKTCGAPANPWGFNLCGNGHHITASDLPGSVCSYFDCIGNFPQGKGYMVECNDHTYSMSGGRSGACSDHKGEGPAVDDPR